LCAGVDATSATYVGRIGCMDIYAPGNKAWKVTNSSHDELYFDKH